MDETSALIAVAEIAVAVAGFSSIATAFGQRSDATFWTAPQRTRFFDLLTHSGIALFASLIPLVMMFQAGSDFSWMWSSLFWAGFGSFGLVAGFLRARRLPTPDGIERFISPVTMLSFLGLILLQFYNVIIAQAFWPYLAALVGNLGFAFIQFMRMIVPREKKARSGED